MTARVAIDARRALWIDGACGLFGAGVHVTYAALGGLGVAPRTWLVFALVSVSYAAIAWLSASTARPDGANDRASAGLTRVIWLNRAWVVWCLIAAAALATGLARIALGGEAVVVGALSVWEARVRDRAA